MEENKKEYVKEFNGLVYKDGLTGVKNKMYYLEYIKSLKNENKKSLYGVVVFSVPGLTAVNKEHGRKYGDSMIITSCRTICKTFSHSPIFRIDGNEFVAVLKGSDLNKMDELLLRFDEMINDIKMEEDSDMPIRVVYGAARSVGENEEYDKVFNRAEQEMYKKKKAKGI